jgi:methionyl-tRNA formyltransferase
VRAAARGLPVICPEKVNCPEVLAQLAAWRPDAAVVVAYGQFLGPALLRLPRLGCLNIHLSLLPRHRGAAPVQWAIACGDARTGVTAMLLDEGMDSGPLLLQAEEPIREDDTAGTLHARLAALGASMLCDVLPRWAAGDLRPVPQDPAGVTLAPKLRKEDGLLDWRAGAAAIDRRVRAFNPWPACHVSLPPRPGTAAGGRERLKILRVAPLPGFAGVDPSLPPGAVCDLRTGEGPAVRVGDGAVRLLEVQPESGRVMSGCALACGRRLRLGEVFGGTEG